ncbi:hypothetical protein KZ820_07195 [Sphingomonas sp. RRHST34]|uniref:Uncharacterized protein n=1 Tax=Sphingomonas citri TaxID=2862499 RepID=A0ABS7BLN9_9SPHN|nr:hypothetical protein [Sphingomonas citri]MBW6530518.1 hypothetical protein [Sphingomonas citri]
MPADKVTFRNDTSLDVAILVFYGATDGLCVDKPRRRNITMQPGAKDDFDFGPDLICYCYQPAVSGPPPENCGHQQARPGDLVVLI